MEFTKEDVVLLNGLRNEFVGKWVNCDGRTALVESIVYNIDSGGVRVRLRTLGKSEVDRAVEFAVEFGGFAGSARMAQRRLREMLVLGGVCNV